MPAHRSAAGKRGQVPHLLAHDPDPRLDPRTALVTGGAKRIGRAIALALAEAGFDVAVHFHTSAAEASATAAAIAALGRRGSHSRPISLARTRWSGSFRPPPRHSGQSACW